MKYDPTNKLHCLIETDRDLKKLNSSDYSHYFVKNGTYTRATINNPSDRPKYIVLLNGNYHHPASLSHGKHTNISIHFANTKNWYVERLSSINHGWTGHSVAFKLYPGCENIHFHKMYGYRFDRFLEIQNGCKNIKLTNSHLDTMSISGLLAENSAIMVGSNNPLESVTIPNVWIKNNDIRNCADNIYFLRHGGNDTTPPQYADYQGAWIDNNIIWNDSEMRTDGNGNFDPNGHWGYGEEGMDIQAGSEDPNNPMDVSHNLIFGFSPTDRTRPGAHGIGYGIGFHNHVKNCYIIGNTVYDCKYGIGFRNRGKLPATGENCVIKHNKLIDISKHWDDGHYMGLMQGFDNSEVLFNTFVNPYGKKKYDTWQIGQNVKFRVNHVQKEYQGKFVYNRYKKKKSVLEIDLKHRLA